MVFRSLILILALLPQLVSAQSELDSLKNELSISRSNKVPILIEISSFFHATNLDSSTHYMVKALALAKQRGDDIELIHVYNEMARIKILSASFEEALDYSFKAESLCKSPDIAHKTELIKIYSNFGVIYERRQELPKSLSYFETAIALIDEVEKVKPSTKNLLYYAPLYNNIANTLIRLGDTTKAIAYQKKGLTYALETHDDAQAANLYNNLGKTLMELRHLSEALPYLIKGLNLRKKMGNERGVSWSYRNIALFYLAKGKTDSAKYFIHKSLASSSKVGGNMLDSYDVGYMLLADIYEKEKRYDSALIAYKLHNQYKDSVYNGPRFKNLARIEAKYEMENKNLAAETERKSRELKITVIIAALILGLLTTLFLYNLQKSKSKNQKLKYEQLEIREENLLIEKKNLNIELEYKSKDLTTHVLYLLKKDELIQKIIDKLLTFKKELASENQQKVLKITKDLRGILERNDNSWQEFELRFKEVHKDFYEKLTSSFPDITPKERRLCALLKLNMTSKEISSITNQSTRSIDVARTRLRKKFNMTNSEVGLVDFLSGF